MKFGLDQKVINKIKAVFFKFPSIEEVVLYGSRAKGNYKNGSDIDFSLKGYKLDLNALYRISNELDDLLLPYTFDLSIFDQINDSDLVDHIKRVGIVFYKKENRK